MSGKLSSRDKKLFKKELYDILVRQERKAVKLADDKVEELSKSIDAFFDEEERNIQLLSQQYEAQENSKIVKIQKIKEMIVEEAQKPNFLFGPSLDLIKEVSQKFGTSANLEHAHHKERPLLEV